MGFVLFVLQPFGAFINEQGNVRGLVRPLGCLKEREGVREPKVEWFYAPAHHCPQQVNMVVAGAKMRCEHDVSHVPVARVHRVRHDYPLGEPLHRVLGL